MKHFSLIFFFLLGISIHSQNHADSERLATLKYMEMTKGIDCENTTGTSIESRICLNYKFQKIDSILNLRLVSYLNKIESDSLKSQIKTYQEKWVLNRRLQSEIFSECLNSNALGINYLWSMINSTELRIQELELLIESN